MATSGSKSVTVTSWDTLKFSWWENSQSVENNTTVIGWKMELIATSYGRIDSSGSRNWSVTVNGTKYSGTNTVGISNNTTKTLASGTTTISHNADGTKSFNYSFSQQFSITFSGSSIGTISGSGSGTLDTIARASQPSCITYPNNTQNVGDFGSTITIHMNRKSSSFTHTVRYIYGTKKGTIATGVTDNTAWTIPLSLMNEIPDALSGYGEIHVDTYNGSTLIGTKICGFIPTVPASVKPSCKITVSEGTSHGAYIKGLSTLKVTITPTIAYGSAIASYSTSANGVKYSAASFATGVITSSGTLTITATVTDQRGRSGTATATVNVYDYSVPQIKLLKVKRCVSLTDGTEDINGEFAEVTFSTQITALDNKNSANYTLEYKKTSEGNDAYIPVQLSNYANQYNVTNGFYRFAADSGSSYDVRIVATDDFEPTPKTTALSTGAVIEHWRSDGKGMGFGKMGEVENGVDFGYVARFSNGILQPVLVENTDFNEVRKPNTYSLKNAANAGYLNCPIASGTGELTVRSSGADYQIHQILDVCNKTNPQRYERFYYGSVWGEWVNTSNFEGKLLWSGQNYMHAEQNAPLSENVSKQLHGIELVFSSFSDGVANNSNFNHFFVHKRFVVAQNGVSSTFVMSTANFLSVCTKRLYIADNIIYGAEGNTGTGTNNGITFNNSAFVLRYVLGV